MDVEELKCCSGRGSKIDLGEGGDWMQEEFRTQVPERCDAFLGGSGGSNLGGGGNPPVLPPVLKH